jgi:phospholipid transport system transporter-binding protein
MSPAAMSPAAAAPASADEAGGTFRLVATGSGRYEAAGALTFATARRARELGERLLKGADGAALEIDCAGVTASDSAGLAVLIDWLGTARHAGARLRYSHLPAGLNALASISEVEELLTRGV